MDGRCYGRESRYARSNGMVFTGLWERVLNSFLFLYWILVWQSRCLDTILEGDSWSSGELGFVMIDTIR